MEIFKTIYILSSVCSQYKNRNKTQYDFTLKNNLKST